MLSETRLIAAAIISAIVGVQLGAFSVVLHTLFSGVTELPFDTFVLLMQPIHLAIGLVEGLATAGIVSFILNVRPEILDTALNGQPQGNLPVKNIFIGFLAAALLTGGLFTWFASEKPDGLEWSIEKVAGSTKPEIQDRPIYNELDKIQTRTSLMPDYNFKENEAKASSAVPYNSSRTESSLAGLLGGMITLTFSIIIGIILKRRSHIA